MKFCCLVMGETAFPSWTDRRLFHPVKPSSRCLPISDVLGVEQPRNIRRHLSATGNHPHRDFSLPPVGNFFGDYTILK
jgi:hypothetical protein